MTKSAKKTTAITRRRQEFFVLRRRFRFDLFCELCGTDGEFVTIDDAVLFSGLSTREIVWLVETKKIHFLETNRGHLFVCRQSLLANESAVFVENDVFQTQQLNTNLQGEKK
jgi:hypothetical protein